MPSNTGNWLVSTCPACQTPLHSTAYSLPSLVQDSSVSLLLLLPWPRLLLDVSVYHCNHIAAGTAYCGYEQHFTAVYCLKNNSWGSQYSLHQCSLLIHSYSIQLFKKRQSVRGILELKCHRTVLILAGVLVDLHASPADPASRECGPVNMEAVQQVIPPHAAPGCTVWCRWWRPSGR